MIFSGISSKNLNKVSARLIMREGKHYQNEKETETFSMLLLGTDLLWAKPLYANDIVLILQSYEFTVFTV